MAAFFSPSGSVKALLAIAPIVAVLLAFYTVGLVREEMFPPYVYLFLALVLMTSGLLGLRSGSPAVLATLALGELSGYLAGQAEPLAAGANLAGLVLASVAIPLVARARIWSLSASQRRLTREQLEARLHLGERLAKGATPNPELCAQPVGGSESLVRNLLLPAKKALRCRTAVFYWYNAEEDLLVPVEAFSDCTELLTQASMSLKQGRLGGLKANREPLAFRFSPHVTHSTPVYRKRIELTGLLAVPVHHRGALAGAFLFDRAEGEGFFLPELVVARRLADMVEESLVMERRLKSAVLLSQQFRMLDEAARQFSTARTFEQVYDTAVRYAVGFSPFATAVLTHRVGPGSDDHEIVGVSRKQMTGLLGKRFNPRGTLCDLAVQARSPLPANFTFDRRSPQPFGPDMGLELDEDDACVLIPLTIRDEAVGFLLLAENRVPVQREDLTSLFLFAEYCAISLVNAEANQELERMAVSDALTGIPNHRAFRSRMVEAVQRSERSKRPLSLLLLDIDHFKSINDSRGHPVGDAVLRRVARTLAESVRKVDFVARYGGEEFVAVMEDTGSAGALVMAERLRHKIGELRFDELGPGQVVTVSIGVASYPDDAHTIEELVALADTALYRAKSEGRNQSQAA